MESIHYFAKGGFPISKTGNFSLEDKPRQGHPKGLNSVGSYCYSKSCNYGYREVSEEFNISHKTESYADWKGVSVVGKWILHNLFP